MTPKKHKPKRPGRKPTYPWDEWFSRKSFVLESYKHFHCSVEGMAQMVRSRAADRRLSVRVVTVFNDTDKNRTGEVHARVVGKLGAK